MMRKLSLAVAATAMALTPMVAPAAMAQSTEVARSDDDRGRNAVIIGLLAAAAVIAGIVLLADSNDSDDQPVSV